MRNRLRDYIYVLLVLLETLPPPTICHARVTINDAHRTKRDVPPEVSRPRQVQRSNVDKSIDYDDNVASLQRVEDEDEADVYAEETAKDTARQKDDKETGAAPSVRLPRDVNAGLNRYTDQNERSSLYDDYEAKDVAKRGILGGPEDYEEEEEEDDDDVNGSSMMDDMAAVKEQGSLMDEGLTEKRATRGDARVKRDQSKVSDKSDSNSNDLPKDSHSHQISCIESSKMNGSNDEASGSMDALKSDRATSAAASKTGGESNDAEYESRVEEEIQRKIDSIKEDIQRDIEAQRRINDIERNNAKFDELQDQEHEDEERENSERESIEKRQTVAKRSIRGNDNDQVVPSPRSGGKKRSVKGEEQHARELHRRSNVEIAKSDTKAQLPCKDNIKKRTNDDAVVSGQTSSKGPSKKKRNRVRQTYLVNNDQPRTKRRRSRSYASSLGRTGVRPENELFITDQDLNSYLHTDNRMDRSPSSVAGEGENDEETRSLGAAARPNSLASLTESSQDLSPRLAKEYKEAFGGLQSEPGSALARFKRIKRVLGSTDAKT